jgi:pentatricopeptide repeat protein
LLSFWEMEWCQKEGFDTLELLESLCCAGRMDKAVEVVDKVLEKNKVCCLSVSAGITILEWLMNARKLDEVCSLMGRMVDQVIVPDTIFCNCIFEEH